MNELKLKKHHLMSNIAETVNALKKTKDVLKKP